MLFLSRSKVTVRESDDVRVEGELRRYRVKIAALVKDLGISNAVIRHRAGRFIFSGNVDAATQQTLRNFFVNECAP